MTNTGSARVPHAHAQAKKSRIDEIEEVERIVREAGRRAFLLPADLAKLEEVRRELLDSAPRNIAGALIPLHGAANLLNAAQIEGELGRYEAFNDVKASSDLLVALVHIDRLRAGVILPTPTAAIFLSEALLKHWRRASPRRSKAIADANDDSAVYQRDLVKQYALELRAKGVQRAHLASAIAKDPKMSAKLGIGERAIRGYLAEIEAEGVDLGRKKRK